MGFSIDARFEDLTESFEEEIRKENNKQGTIIRSTEHRVDKEIQKAAELECRDVEIDVETIDLDKPFRDLPKAFGRLFEGPAGIA